MTLRRGILVMKRAGAALFYRRFGAPSEQQLWGMMVPRERPRRRVGVVIVARMSGTGMVARN